jgi:predicted transcriptional regulator
MATATTSLKLDPAMKERIERLAAAKDRSAHWVMKRAIEQFVDREEAEEQFRRDAEDAWEHYQRTGLHLTNAEVMDWLERRIRGEAVQLPKSHT